MAEIADDGLDGALRRLAASSRALLALDFDGVLSPIVEHPDDARPLPAAAAALARLARVGSLRLALVSGRRLDDLVAVASPPPGVILVGSHGAERGVVQPDGGITVEPLDLTDRQRTTLREITETVTEMAEAASAPGGWVEHKPAAVVVHTRRMPERAAAELERAVLQSMADRAELRVVPGKRVVELSVVPATKGEAVTALRTQTGAAIVLYAGDDVTDEDALRSLTAGDVGVKVGPGETAASHRVADPAAVARLLTRLADLVQAGTGADASTAM